jgi:hypothetical protein
LFQSVNRRVERSLLDLEDLCTDLLDTLRNSPAVHWLEGDSFENEQVERALDQIGRFAHGVPLDYLQYMDNLR